MTRKTFVVLEWENTLASREYDTLLNGVEDFLKYLNANGYHILLISQLLPAAIERILAENGIQFTHPVTILNPDFLEIVAPKREPEKPAKKSKLYDLVVDSDEEEDSLVTVVQAEFAPDIGLDTKKALLVQRHREEPIKHHSSENPVRLHTFEDYLIISRNQSFLLNAVRLGFPTYPLRNPQPFVKVQSMLELYAFEPKKKRPSRFEFFNRRNETRRLQQWAAADALIKFSYTGEIPGKKHEKALKDEPLKTFNRALRK